MFLRLALMSGYGITDCGVKWGRCAVERGLSSDFCSSNN